MKHSNLIMLVIDDEEADLFLIERAFRQNGMADEIHCVNSASKAMAYMNGENEYTDRIRFPQPTLVMTDLKMPEQDGFVVLEYLKQHPQLKIIPVLVLSASNDADDIKRSYAMGASCYLEKPTEPTELRRILKLCYDFWKECQVPEVDGTGQHSKTQFMGKLGERFGPIE